MSPPSPSWSEQAQEWSPRWKNGLGRSPENRSPSSAARGTTGVTDSSSDDCCDAKSPSTAAPTRLSNRARSRRENHVSTVSASGRTIGHHPPYRCRGLRRRLTASDIIVDAIVGTGLSAPMTGSTVTQFGHQCLGPPHRCRRPSIRPPRRYRKRPGSCGASRSDSDLRPAKNRVL